MQRSPKPGNLMPWIVKPEVVFSMATVRHVPWAVTGTPIKLVPDLSTTPMCLVFGEERSDEGRI